MPPPQCNQTAPPPFTATMVATKVAIPDSAPADVEEWDYDDVKGFLTANKAKYRLETEDITLIKNQKVHGRILLKMTYNV